jgi:hypothetical protein
MLDLARPGGVEDKVYISANLDLLHESHLWQVDVALAEGRDDMASRFAEDFGDEALLTLATPPADFGRC